MSNLENIADKVLLASYSVLGLSFANMIYRYTETIDPTSAEDAHAKHVAYIKSQKIVGYAAAVSFATMTAVDVIRRWN